MAIVELLNRGAIHFILYNDAKIDYRGLEKIWGNEFVYIGDIKNNYDDIERKKLEMKLYP